MIKIALCNSSGNIFTKNYFEKSYKFKFIRQLKTLLINVYKKKSSVKFTFNLLVIIKCKNDQLNAFIILTFFRKRTF